MIYADIDENGRARGFYAAWLHGASVPDGAIAIDAETHQRWIADTLGQRWDGTALVPCAPPPMPAPPPIRVIRSLAFRMRLPDARRVAITGAALAAAASDGGAAMTFLLDQASSVTTDLDDARVVAGVAALRAANLITAAEASALLADGTAAETR
jgi:hypothetical protein